MTALVVLSVLVWSMVPTRLGIVVGTVMAAAVVHPLLAFAAAAMGVVLHRIRRIRSLRRDAERGSSEAIMALELVGLGVTAGLPFRNAAALTADELSGPVSEEIHRALRSVDAGHEPRTETPEIRMMFNNAAISESTGTPLPGVLNALAMDRRRSESAAVRTRIAKLPVKLLFPLAFLILPGFVLLTVVPPLVSGLSRLTQ